MCGVKKLAKAILIGTAALAVLALVSVVGVNLYVQSPGARDRIQAELSKALNTPLRITNTSLSPWGGLSINGITIPGETGTMLDAASFKANYRALPLFRRELVIHEVVLDRPNLIWIQNAEGKWVWPQLAKKDQDEPGEKPEPKETKKRDRGRGSGFRVTVSGFKVNQGSVELLTADQQKVATLTDVNLTYSELSEERISGLAAIGRVAWSGGVAIDTVQTTFSYINGTLEIPDLQGNLGGGTMRGSLRINRKADHAPFTLAMKLEQVDLAKLATEAAWPAGTAGGTLEAEVELHGNANKFEQAEGKGRINVARGQFRHLEFFQTIGQVLGVPELADLRLKQAHAEFHLADEKVFIEGLTLEAPELELFTHGVVRFDQALSLEARLSLSERIRLPSFVKDSFIATDKPGQRAIEFKIGGRIDRPKTDLAEKLVGKRLGNQVEELFTNIFGGKKKKKEEEGRPKKEKKKNKDERKPVSEESSAVAAPGEAPALKLQKLPDSE